MALTQCRLAGCELPGTLRGGFCTEAHRDEHKRSGWRLRKKRQRERAADSILDGHVAAESGRAIPGRGEIAAPGEYHPSVIRARRAAQENIEVVDYVTGSSGRPGVHERQPARPDLQRMGKGSNRWPTEEQNWAPQEDGDYYGGVTFPRNDMSAGPYRGGPAHAGTPVAFEVRRASR